MSSPLDISRRFLQACKMPHDQFYLASPVIFFNEDNWPLAAIVTYVHPDDLDFSPNPKVNLFAFSANGRFTPRKEVLPAYHDGSKWRTIEKWMELDFYRAHKEFHATDLPHPFASLQLNPVDVTNREVRGNQYERKRRAQAGRIIDRPHPQC